MMNTTTVDVERKALNIKGSMFTATVLQLQTTDLVAIDKQLTTLTIQAPQFFQQAPTVIDVSAIQAELASLDFHALVYQLKTAGLLPVGLVGADATHAAKAIEAGLPTMPQSKHYKPAAPAPEPIPAKAPNTMVIDIPVRSGQRIYAKGTDLIIIGSVSHGAEVLADGHIHIYGALHGRALAGAGGDTQARIFCQRLNAELVAIAGLYQLSEAFVDKQLGAVCISYQQDQLVIAPLTNPL
jgi:septum site-determining protein MinC